MPHYFFRLSRGHRCEEDPDGMDLHDIHAARAEAARVIRELLEDWGGGEPQPLKDMAFEILDEDGRLLLTVPFADFATAEMMD